MVAFPNGVSISFELTMLSDCSGVEACEFPLNEFFFEKIEPKILMVIDKIIQHSWNIGPVIRNNDDLITQIANEKETQWSGKVGLITLSEYLRANTNLQNCATFKLNNENVDECSVTNWLTMSTTYWLISAEYDSSAVWRISMDSSITNNAPNYTPSPSSVVPSVYLTPSITLQGTGTKENPFVIIS